MEDRNSPWTLDLPPKPRPQAPVRQTPAHQAPKPSTKAAHDPAPIITAEEFWKRLGL